MAKEEGINDDGHTCSGCDSYVHDEAQLGLCHLDPPRGSTKPGPDPYPAVKCDGVGCMSHSMRNKKVAGKK